MGIPAIGAGEGLGVEVAVACSVALAVGLAVGVADGLIVGLGDGMAVELAEGVTDGIMDCLAEVAEGWVNIWVGRTGISVKVRGAETNVEAGAVPIRKNLLFVKYQPPIPNKR